MLLALLNQLSDGQFHSGSELGQQLGITRAAVWKNLKKLEEYGVNVLSKPGKGYCIQGGIELLNADTLYSQFTQHTQSLISNLDVHLSIDSTNFYVAGLASRNEISHGYVCLAEQQTAGRGRRGRQWVSPFAGCICLSLFWCFDAGVQATEGLSLALGIAIVKMLTSIGIDECQLKWPNDILCQGKKLGGVLIEVSGDLADQCQTIIGVGMNWQLSNVQANQIDQPYIDIQSICAEQNLKLNLTRNQFTALVIDAFVEVLSNYQYKGFKEYQKLWQTYDAYHDSTVHIISSQETVSGVARGVDVRGALRLETSGGMRFIHSGEVSLRAHHDS